MYEKNAAYLEPETARESSSPLLMGLCIKSENLSRLGDISSSLSHTCGILGIKEEYLTKEDSQLKKVDDLTFIGRDESIYREQQKVLSHIEYLTKQISEFSNI